MLQAINNSYQFHTLFRRTSWLKVSKKDGWICFKTIWLFYLHRHDKKKNYSRAKDVGLSNSKGMTQTNKNQNILS